MVSFLVLSYVAYFINLLFDYFFSQSVSLTQYVVLSVCLSVHLSVRLFQLASELSRDIVARRHSDYCPCGAIFLEYLSKIPQSMIHDR